MNIVVIGPVIMNIKIDLSTKFDESVDNVGVSALSYGGPYVEISKKLASEGHKVILVSSLSTQSFVPVIRMLKKCNIVTDYISYEENGLVFNIQINEKDSRSFNIASSYSSESVVNTFRLNEKELLDDTDVVIFSYIDPRILDIVKRHDKIKLNWYATDEEVEKWDHDDVLTPYIEGVKNVTVNNYMEVIR